MRIIFALAFVGICAINSSYANEPAGEKGGTKVETFQVKLDEAATLGGLARIAEKGSLSSEAGRKSFGVTTNDLTACGMRWHRDEAGPEGLYSVWRPSRPTSIVVNNVRNGKLYGSTTINVRPPNQEISLLINQDGRNHDGVQSCVNTI